MASLALTIVRLWGEEDKTGDLRVRDFVLDFDPDGGRSLEELKAAAAAAAVMTGTTLEEGD